MKNRLFKTGVEARAPKATEFNEAGGRAYKMGAEHALAQIATTGTFGDIYYAKAETQLDDLGRLLKECDPQFIARTALWARQRGYMKDLPAALVAHLASVDVHLMSAVFDRVIDNGKMLRNFAQMIRSGAFGRKSFGSRPKRLMASYLQNRAIKSLFRDSVGEDGASLADIVKMVHPRAKDEERNAFFAYLIGREYDATKLPELIKEWEAYKLCPHGNPPDIEFRMLTSFELPVEAWCRIAARMGWHALRINLNTLKRHGVFEAKVPEDLKAEFDVVTMTELVRKRLSDRDLILKSKVMPYQIMTAYMNTTDVPNEVREGLQDAMEVATELVPQMDGSLLICPDVSGSMSSGSITGNRGSATSVVKPIHIAALFTACMVRKNPNCRVLPFDMEGAYGHGRTERSGIHSEYRANPRDSVVTIAAQISAFGGGGTDCALPLRYANANGLDFKNVVYISDYESWGGSGVGHPGTVTPMMIEWEKYRRRVHGATLVCSDITPYLTNQVPDNRKEILHVGGWSDAVFDIISMFSRGELDSEMWVGQIKAIDL